MIAATRFMCPAAASTPAVGMMTSLGNGKPQLSPTMRTNTASFTSDFNVFFLLRSAAIAVTIGFAQMVVLSIGDMNLSVGAIGGATGMFAGWLMQVLGVPPALAVLLAIALGTTLGFGNAALVVWTHLNSFIVTLATASLITGVMLILTRARPFSNLPDSFVGIAQTELGGVPVAPLVLIMLAVALVLGLVYRSTSLGREMLAI